MAHRHFIVVCGIFNNDYIAVFSWQSPEVQTLFIILLQYVLSHNTYSWKLLALLVYMVILYHLVTEDELIA